MDDEHHEGNDSVGKRVTNIPVDRSFTEPDWNRNVVSFGPVFAGSKPCQMWVEFLHVLFGSQRVAGPKNEHGQGGRTDDVSGYSI